MPPTVLAQLRDRFGAAVNDVEFQAQATRASGFPPRHVRWEKGSATLASAATVSPEIVETVRRTIDASTKR